MWFSYHSGTIFEQFGRWNIRLCLGGVAKGFGKGFSESFGPRKIDFEAFKRGQISKTCFGTVLDGSGCEFRRLPGQVGQIRPFLPPPPLDRNTPKSSIFF